MAESVVSLQLDPSRAHHITILGRKGSGKSVLARRFWDSYPYDRLVIDPTGDVAVDDAADLETPLPARWPTGVNRERSTLRFHPDPAAPTYEDDMDRAVGLGFFHDGPKLVWLDEIAELTRANRVAPHTRKALHQSRHRRLSLLLCGPRPIDVNPLVVSQADYVAAFELPNPNDRRRLADVVGVELRDLEAAAGQLDEHGFLWWDTRQRTLTVMPPLPLRSSRIEENRDSRVLAT